MSQGAVDLFVVVTTKLTLAPVAPMSMDAGLNAPLAPGGRPVTANVTGFGSPLPLAKAKL